MLQLLADSPCYSYISQGHRIVPYEVAYTTSKLLGGQVAHECKGRSSSAKKAIKIDNKLCREDHGGYPQHMSIVVSKHNSKVPKNVEVVSKVNPQ